VRRAQVSAVDRTGRILVTGATQGLGLAVVEALAETGHRVVVHGRDAGRVEATCALARRLGASDAVGLRADLAHLDEVRGLADSVAALDDVDVVVNNAGVGFGGPRDRERQQSWDGVELRLAVNYLAPMVLTQRLLAARPPRRVVQVASAGQHPLDLDDLESRDGFDPLVAYRRSKLALVTGSMDLAERTAGTTLNCVHPATYMPTRMVLESRTRPTGDLGAGVAAVLHQALSPDLAGTTGRYFDGVTVASPHPQAFDPAARHALRSWTARHLLPAGQPIP